MVTGDPEFLGWVYASGEGVGGGWIPGKDALELTLWRLVHTYDGTIILCAYWEIVGRGDVTDRDMIFHMKLAAEKLVLSKQEYPAVYV